MPKKNRWVYFFGGGKADGLGDQRELLGGKGAGLAEMTRIGLPVPGGFTITTEACAAFHGGSNKWPVGLEKEVRGMLTKLERLAKKKLGDAKDPLLVSVRSGAAKSMPGMMETILNLGLNDRSVEGLAAVASSRRFAFDAYRRFIMMHGATAEGIDRGLFDDAFDRIKETRTAIRLGKSPGEKIGDTEVNAEELETLVGDFKRIYREGCGKEFPQDPFEQLKAAIAAVFNSWMADKAVTYRRVEKITGLNGTAVNICRMVFGNMGDDCGTGVCFTRDPSTGEATFYGDMLINAQGEDVVSGVRTPQHLSELKTLMPDVYDQLEAVRVMLEVHYKDMQDLEFTIERGTLYMLQCRTGKRSPAAAFKIAVDQATKGLMTAATAKRLVQRKHLPKKYLAGASKPIITRDQAIRRITAEDIERLFFPVIDPSISMDDLNRRALGEGIGAVPGAACGEVVFSAERAQQRVSAGATVILVRKETSPEDVGGMHVAVGILTATGGKTSHAAVVARGWGKCCIVGCGDLLVDYDNKCFTLNDTIVHEGDPITLDGSSGRIYRGEIGLDRPTAPPEYDTLLGWCDKRRRLGVRANADTPADAAKAVELGAEGIGLCRTEHMFFDPSEPERLRAMREMILADSEDRRCAALAKLLPYQRKDFEGLFTAMDAKPVTIRLLDPPLHEFLPQHDNPEGQQALVDEMNESAGFGSSGTGGNGATAVSGRPPTGSGGGDGGTEYAGDTAAAPAQSDTCVAVVDEAPQAASAQPCAPGEQTGPAGVPRVTLEDVRRRVDQLHETNPMLGHRGCRLCITYPEILEMQVRAIIEAAVACTKRGIKVLPEIMIPLTIDAKELAILTDRTRAVADAILKEHKSKIKYLVGTMIETPRAALVAGKMAEVAEFFSFGTNDLTQMAMGLSRDDAGRFLPEYVDESKAAIFPADPFQTIDVDGVGLLVQLACETGRESRPGLKLGICGEHGGDPASVIFCDVIGLDYVSCSPFRVPIARLAAAQAVIDGTPEPRASARATLRTLGTKAGTTRKTGSRSKTTTKKTKAKPKVKAEVKAKVKAKAKAKVRPQARKKSKTKVAAKKRRTR